MSKRARSTKGQASSYLEETIKEKGLAQSFFDFVNADTFFGPQWINLFQINEPIFRELVCEFFASFEFDATPCRYEPLHKGVTFRLGGVEREMSLLELGWRVGLYFERESRNPMTLSGLKGAETVNSTRLTHLFWPIIGDGGYNVGNTKAKSIRNSRIKLAHRCITMTISGVVEEDKGDGEEGPKSAMDGPTRRPLGRLNTWMEQQDQRAHWMYDHTVRQFQYMSTRDNLKLDLQIDPFLGFEFDYPLYGYHLHMPLGYTYRPNPSQDGSS
nr:putative retrotransposon Orf1 [Tanacetum cinerariifolium]